MTPDSELFITKFESQTLLGFQTDTNGNVLAKVFEGVAVLSDQSTRIIYGIFREGSLAISWDYSGTEAKPVFDRNPLGMKIEK